MHNMAPLKLYVSNISVCWLLLHILLTQRTAWAGILPLFHPAGESPSSQFIKLTPLHTTWPIFSVPRHKCRHLQSMLRVETFNLYGQGDWLFLTGSGQTSAKI